MPRADFVLKKIYSMIKGLGAKPPESSPMYAMIKWGQKWVGQKEARPTRANKWTGCGPPGPITSAAYERW